ncbi:MAG TPA: hypothetical protein VIJ57_04970 [Hanamia sp.]
MITVKKLKEELNKFPDDCLCFAYEGEVIGLIIENAQKAQGVIYCSEDDDRDRNSETELLPQINERCND